MDWEEMELEKLKGSYANWLGSWEWEWFATLTIGRLSRRFAIQLFDRWVKRLGKKEGTSRFRWFRVLDRGSSGKYFRFRVLIGGLRSRKPHWGRRWQELGGEALFQKYDREKEVIRYLLQTVTENEDFDFAIHVPSDGDVDCD